MTFKIITAEHGTNIEFKAETTEEAGMLMDICVNTKREPTDIYLSFDPENPVELNMWFKKVDRNQQKSGLLKRDIK